MFFKMFGGLALDTCELKIVKLNIFDFFRKLAEHIKIFSLKYRQRIGVIAGSGAERLEKTRLTCLSKYQFF